MSNVLYRIGHFAGRHPWRVIGAWVVVAVAVVHAQLPPVAAPTTRSFTLPGAESQARGGRDRGALPAGDALRLERHLPLGGRPHRS